MEINGIWEIEGMNTGGFVKNEFFWNAEFELGGDGTIGIASNLGERSLYV